MVQESNPDHFVSERSADGQNFFPIGKVTAKGNSSLISYYEFADPRPESDSNSYYRLQEVDLDGHIEYSVIKYVHAGMGNASSVQIYPNPVRDILNVIV